MNEHLQHTADDQNHPFMIKMMIHQSLKNYATISYTGYNTNEEGSLFVPDRFHFILYTYYLLSKPYSDLNRKILARDSNLSRTRG